ncbi:hypothetical protein Ciccas_002467 [Cichlidogyrus casuarinus]|uniref:Uncharacterized protein n=1 Tax=Cichlidogyrus casuarinus TaxID=1844966 RepID=A0ABD2QKD2_9PLAT
MNSAEEIGIWAWLLRSFSDLGARTDNLYSVLVMIILCLLLFSCCLTTIACCKFKKTCCSAASRRRIKVAEVPPTQLQVDESLHLLSAEESHCSNPRLPTAILNSLPSDSQRTSISIARETRRVSRPRYPQTEKIKQEVNSCCSSCADPISRKPNSTTTPEVALNPNSVAGLFTGHINGRYPPAPPPSSYHAPIGQTVGHSDVEDEYGVGFLKNASSLLNSPPVIPESKRRRSHQRSPRIVTLFDADESEREELPSRRHQRHSRDHSHCIKTSSYCYRCHDHRPYVGPFLDAKYSLYSFIIEKLCQTLLVPIWY